MTKGTVCPYIPSQSPNDIKALVTLWMNGAMVCLISPKTPPLQIKKQLAVLPKKFNYSGTIMFTSGSNGIPKAVVHSLENHYFNALGSNKNIPFKPGDRWLLSLPLYHVSGMGIIWRSIVGGGTIVFPDTMKLDEAVKVLKVTHLSLVPTQLIRLLNKPSNIKHLKKLKAILLGGAPIPESLLTTCRKLKLRVFLTYGLTEMASQVATSRKPSGPVNILDYRELKITQGEIWVRGKTLFKGYWKNKKLEKPFHKGWFATGDMGTFTKQGGLKVIGRKDNMFISGGENIYPEEIEKALLSTGLVEKATVVTVPDEIYGFRPVAFIKTSRHCEPTKRAWQSVLTHQLKTILPSFKIPDQYLSFPKAFQQHGIKSDRRMLIEYLKRS